MPPLAQGRSTPKDSKPKNKKSRNGCAQCKIKRLKCDETVPACHQCTKRNYPCPGYEKTLKWSTKYELLQSPPTQRQRAPSPKKAAPQTSTSQGTSVPADVANGFEALAAVLPASKKSSTNASQAPTPPPEPLVADEPPLMYGGSSPEGLNSPSEPELPPMEKFMDVAPFSWVDDELLMSGGLDLPNNDIGLQCTDVETGSLHSSSTEPSADEQSPRPSCSLLLDYYRLPSPTSMSPSPSLDHLLLQHYFEVVCKSFSSFDSRLNPFRTVVSAGFQNSSSMYYGIQSMAAAHLANTFHHMAQIGVDLQRQAVEHLSQELSLATNNPKGNTATLLSVLLLGLSTSWHDSSDLGERFLSHARTLIFPKLIECSTGGATSYREAQFFEESLIYWEMLMGFVTEDAMTYSSSRSGARRRTVSNTPTNDPKKMNRKINPHPWTGIAPTINILFAEVGRLVRRERVLSMNGSGIDFRRSRENLENALTLEEDLLAADIPKADQIEETEDEQTPKDHFIIMAQAYRCTALLEIYRVFPTILRKRLGTKPSTLSDRFDFTMPRFESMYEDMDIKLWLNSLAMHIISLLESLPASSGTMTTQPILLVAAASELKLVASLDFFDISANDHKVLQARDFVDKRLREYAHRMAAKPVKQMIDLVNTVWRRLDEGESVFWIDVMVQNGWHTVMG